MEDVKNVENCWINKHPVLKTPWFKSLVYFLIFLAIFGLGIRFGQRNDDHKNFQMMRGCQQQMENRARYGFDRQNSMGAFRNDTFSQQAKFGQNQPVDNEKVSSQDKAPSGIIQQTTSGVNNNVPVQQDKKTIN